MADPDVPPLPPPTDRRHAATVFIFITVVLDVLALGIIVPVLPRLVLGFLHGNTARSAEVFGLFGTLWSAMQFVFGPILGALSDRFGRRPVILLSNLGLGLDYILMALAPSIGFLLVGRVISGITAASFPTAGAYIADVTPPERRAGAFGLLGAAFGLGFVLGPALGGLLGQVDPRLPFWVAAGLSLANAGYGYFVLPESLPREKRAAFAWRKANPVAAVGMLRSHPELSALSVVVTLFSLAHEVFPSVFVLYAGYRFGWEPITVGLTLAAAGVCSAGVQGGLARPVVARLGERGAVLAGSVFGVLGFALYGLATVPWAFWLAVPLVSLWGLAGPATQAIMSRCVGPSEQGRLQGAMGSVRGITGMIGPGLFTAIFAGFIENGWAVRHGWQHLPGAPFLLSALLVTAGLGMAVVTTGRRGLASGAGTTLPEPGLPEGFTPEVR